GNVNLEMDEYGNPTFTNPVFGLANPNVNRMQSLQWNGNLSYRIVDGLEAKMNMGFNQLEQNDKHLIYKNNANPLQSAIARSTTNQRLVDRKYLLIEPQLHYTKNSRKHSISSLVGATFQKNESSEKYLRGQGYSSESQIGNIALAQDRSVLIDDIF